MQNRSKMAGILCNDTRFQDFAKDQLGLPERPNSTATAEFMRNKCAIQSRAVLNKDPAAASRFDCLVTDYDQWRGIIATPNQ